MARIEAAIVERGGSIFLLKCCPRHGEQRALLEKNAAYYLARLEFDKPGTSSNIQTTRRRGCPFDCGLCPEHRQHTCIGLIEITQTCDLYCPSCYADSRLGGMLDLETIGRMMDFYQEAENGRAEILQISGGEPTTHPRLLEILRLARSKQFKCVMLNTNGLRLVQDDALVRSLAEFRNGFEVYLQFDGFDGVSGRRFRGRDLAPLKRRVVDQLAAHGIPMTLVATIEKDVNDHEIGALVEFAMDAACVRGINFQPLAFFGRGHGRRPEHRTTLTDILERIEAQTARNIRMSDFIPLPCNVERVAITYLHRTDGGFAPITRALNLRQSLPLISNTFAFDPDDFIAAACQASEPSPTRACDCAKMLLAGLRPLIPSDYEMRNTTDKTRHINENTFRISVSSFVDADNFDDRSMQKECVHVLTPDLRRIPFSAYNMLHRSHAKLS